MGCSKAFTKWVIKNCRPYKILDDAGLRNVAEILIKIGANYGSKVDVEHLLPHPTTIARSVKSLYEKNFEEVKTEVLTAASNGFALTTDLWTDNYLRKSFLALTFHFIRGGVLKVRLLGFRSMDGERCTSKFRFE